uniref:Extracellular hemoglobin linker L4 subunit n=1 Tax=Lumbricus terrestris TaxID=6398 RepID=Q2I741_LUMTE|nr:extracellular hemoglobin linker L4 subunit precursor [Lumbricus terrestris]
MRGPFIGVVVVVLAAVACLLQVDAAAEEDNRARDISERIDKLTAEAFKLGRNLDARLDPIRIKKAGTLKARVDAIAEPTCDEHEYQCGGDDPQCVGDLLVCDGITDCRNGDDEKHCVLPFAKGDTFVGDQEFDHCGRFNPDHITLHIDSVTTIPFFTSHPKVTGRVDIHVDRDDDWAVSTPSFGFYSFATHRIIFRTPDKDSLYLVAQFDGYNFDRFVGETLRVGTGLPCARFIYKRQH